MATANLLLKSAVLLPLPFLVMAGVYGGFWGFVALFYLSIFCFLADESLVASGESGRKQGWFDSLIARHVPVFLALAHLLLLPLGVMAVAVGPSGLIPKFGMFLAYGLFFGIVSTANAHELIHRRDRFRHHLGKWVFISLLFGHHTSAHLLVHHRHAATPLDPNTAKPNESFYHFIPRAWRGSFLAGLAAERARLKRTRRGSSLSTNPYVIYALGAAMFLALSYFLAGWLGIAVHLGFAFLAQTQLLLSDYVQHYGLARAEIKSGKYQPVTIQHSWNAPHVFSSALMMNAPRHSDHHAHPSIQYSDLRTLALQGAPVLPYSLPVMSFLALFPGTWRRVMSPRLTQWHRQQSGI